LNDRYRQQVRFAPFGTHGQERWQRATVGIVGLGGLGAALAAHVVRTGAGRAILIDRDFVEDSNLPRQILYTAADAARALPKAAAAKDHLSDVGSATQIVAAVEDLTVRSVERLLQSCDLVLDGLDNVEARLLINDYCRRERKPWVYGGAVGSTGAVLLVTRDGPCLRCLFPELESAPPLETCDTAGVLSPLPAMVASLQVAEAMRCLAEAEPAPRLWHIDSWSGHAFVSDSLSLAPDCPCCARGTFPALDRPASTTAQLCGRGMIQITPARVLELDLADVARRWKDTGAVDCNPFLVRLKLEDCTIVLFPDGRALIQGVDNAERARSLYARYVGT